MTPIGSRDRIRRALAPLHLGRHHETILTALFHRIGRHTQVRMNQQEVRSVERLMATPDWKSVIGAVLSGRTISLDTSLDQQFIVVSPATS